MRGNEAEVALKLFESFGIARERLTPEDKSHNTVENALFSKALAAPKPGERWLLVTSAYHMPRAIGIFRRAGFAVEAYPVDWRTRGRVDLMMPFEIADRWLAPHRHRRARVGRAPRLLGDRAELGAISRTVRLG